MHESNVRFEHCYRLDLDPEIVPTHRLACWREWSMRYTYGQNRDRLEYARRRMELLKSGDSRALELSLDGGAGLDAAPSLAFVPVSPAAPPPVVRPVEVAPPPSAAPPPVAEAAPPPPRPRDACVQRCASAHDACADECDDERARSCVRCEREYEACMRRCFR